MQMAVFFISLLLCSVYWCGIDAVVPEAKNQSVTRNHKQVSKQRSELQGQLEPEECGKVTTSRNRIYQGYDAERGDFPWMALLSIPVRSKAGGSTVTVSCSSAIISRWYILTAAHCLSNYPVVGPIKVTVGMVVMGDSKGVTYTVKFKNAVVHKGYDPHKFPDFDIALLRMDTPIKFTNYIRPICLPASNNSFAKTRANIAGWGKIGPLRAKTLQAGKLSVMDNKHCRRKLKRLSDNMICANVNPKTPHACKGDSGGPLMNYWHKRYYVVGVLSFGETRDQCRYATLPNVYIRVSKFLNWIRRKTRQQTTKHENITKSTSSPGIKT